MEHSLQGVGEMLKSALERRDLESYMSLFADNSELCVIDKNHPPSAPLVLKGKQAIHDYTSDIFKRDMAHHVDNEIFGDHHMAYSEMCEYPDGTRVFAQFMLELSDGKIVKDTEVQAWDESV